MNKKAIAKMGEIVKTEVENITGYANTKNMEKWVSQSVKYAFEMGYVMGEQNQLLVLQKENK